ncbi:MAG: M15 family metallopeptidase, partial [Alistipes sp.]|nr:M15 family metallopeptidase [Alistipes sp.]
LRYIRALHITNEGIIKVGEMVVNRAISDDILYILRRLFDAGYAIERMELVDNYNADDEASMAANNSSAFNFRTTPGGTRLSAHSRGMAVDINPLYNPYVKVNGGKVIVAPKSADGYIDRNKTFPYKICKGDLCCRLFAERGFEWGGDYRTIKDYQHFEK